MTEETNSQPETSEEEMGGVTISVHIKGDAMAISSNLDPSFPRLWPFIAKELSRAVTMAIHQMEVASQNEPKRVVIPHFAMPPGRGMS